jgi:hypothetical protein
LRQIKFAFNLSPSFASQQGISNAAYKLNITVDSGGQGGKAAGIYLQDLACLQIPLQKSPSGMNESQTVTRQPLQDEALSSKDAGAKLLGESHLYLDASGGAEKA